MTDKLESANQFANAATVFCSLVSSPCSSLDQFAPQLLSSLTALYSAALALPKDLNVSSNEFLCIPDDEWQQIHCNISEVCGVKDIHSFVFDPTYPVEGSSEPCCGMLGDDCADIYRDIITPLKAFRAGQLDILDDIIWEWSSTPFESHWGLHALSAMYALHWIVY